MARTIGIVFSGFMMKLYAAAFALYVGSKAAAYAADVFSAGSAISNAL